MVPNTWQQVDGKGQSHLREAWIRQQRVINAGTNRGAKAKRGERKKTQQCENGSIQIRYAGANREETRKGANVGDEKKSILECGFLKSTGKTKKNRRET